MLIYMLIAANPNYNVLGTYSSLNDAKNDLFNLDEDCRNSGSWVDGIEGDSSLFSNYDGSEMGYYIIKGHI